MAIRSVTVDEPGADSKNNTSTGKLHKAAAHQKHTDKSRHESHIGGGYMGTASSKQVIPYIPKL